VTKAIGVCFNITSDLAGCDTADKIGLTLPSGLTTGALKSVTVTANTAAVVATPNAYKGILATETCTMTPTVSADGTSLSWAYSGGCKDSGYVK
jgi:type IV pilus assembly protein PilA